jgi:hypothetical protein
VSSGVSTAACEVKPRRWSEELLLLNPQRRAGKKTEGEGTMQQDVFLYVTATALAISAVTAYPAVAAHVAWQRNPKTTSAKYEDEDGDATPESLAAFSTQWQKLHILAWAVAGLGCQIAFSVILDTSRPSLHVPPEGFSLQNWLLTAAWVRACPIL